MKTLPWSVETVCKRSPSYHQEFMISWFSDRLEQFLSLSVTNFKITEANFVVLTSYGNSLGQLIYCIYNN